MTSFPPSDKFFCFASAGDCASHVKTWQQPLKAGYTCVILISKRDRPNNKKTPVVASRRYEAERLVRRRIVEERFSRALEKLDKTVSELTLLEWTLMVLTSVRIVTLVLD